MLITLAFGLLSPPVHAFLDAPVVWDATERSLPLLSETPFTFQDA